jgi:putative Mn2+ efflux pump MntP
VGQRASEPQSGLANALRVGLAFGIAQGSMPLLGLGLGVAFEAIVRDLDHWIAFVVLVAIGAHMIHAGRKPQTNQRAVAARGWGLVGIAIATTSMQLRPASRSRSSIRPCWCPASS